MSNKKCLIICFKGNVSEKFARLLAIVVIFTLLSRLKERLSGHGSVNWFLPKRLSDDKVNSFISDETSRMRAACSRIYQPTLPIPFNVKVVEPSDSSLNNGPSVFNRSLFNHEYGYPLILIPLSIKLYDVHIEGFKPNVVDKAKSLIKDTGEVYIIGYRANDDIINEILEPLSPKSKDSSCK